MSIDDAERESTGSAKALRDTPARRRILLSCKCGRRLISYDDAGNIVIRSRPFIVGHRSLAKCHKCRQEMEVPPDVMASIAQAGVAQEMFDWAQDEVAEDKDDESS